MYCENCGATCPKRSKFCPVCGAAFQKQKKRREHVDHKAPAERKSGAWILLLILIVCIAIFGTLFFMVMKR